jgi:hypothetical protein
MIKPNLHIEHTIGHMISVSIVTKIHHDKAGKIVLWHDEPWLLWKLSSAGMNVGSIIMYSLFMSYVVNFKCNNDKEK